ncbi:hypothetical protein [Endozoicomonas sp.]|nr:hypothetical protein [Endozoicomonas sp.]
MKKGERGGYDHHVAGIIDIMAHVMERYSLIRQMSILPIVCDGI